MPVTEQDYLAGLRGHASETLTLLSNSQKSERERMVVRAFLRCIGENFADEEIKVGREEPIDIIFRSARFQIRDFVGDKKRGRDWQERKARWEAATTISDVMEPSSTIAAMSIEEVSLAVVSGLAEKARRYGSACATLDALAYIDAGYRLAPHNMPLSETVADELARQGWRSVSLLSVPYAAVLSAEPDAAAFLGNRVGRVLKEWPGLDDWFDA